MNPAGRMAAEWRPIKASVARHSSGLVPVSSCLFLSVCLVRSLLVVTPSLLPQVKACDAAVALVASNH
jgi:hypothetical protein